MLLDIIHMWNLKKKAKYMQRIAWQLAGAEKERK
jgi:hypothetical protein